MRRSKPAPSATALLTGTPDAARRSIGLRDVARAAGVSTATVSRAINNPEIVSPDLRARIETAVAHLGWVPDGAARALSTRRSQTVGAVFPALSVGDFARATHAIQSELSSHSYTLLLACSEYDPELELSQVRKFVERGVDGLILVGQAHHPDIARVLEQRAIPHVNTFVYDRNRPETCVGPDNHRAMQMMTDYLADLGHVRFAAIAQSTTNNDRSQARLEGMSHALALRGLAVRPQHIQIGHWTIADGRALFRKVMQTDPRPTAVICGNAHLAVGAVLEAMSMGLRLPEDLSIVGYDDIEVMSHLPIPVTTVRVPGDAIGALAARLLIARLEGQSFSEKLEVEAEIIIRASSGPPSAG